KLTTENFRQFTIHNSSFLITCDRQLDNELAARRTVLLGPDRAVVFGDDAAGDGESQAGAAVFGGEVRKEEPFLGVRRDAGPAVGHDDLNYVAARVERGADPDLFGRGMFEGLGGVIDQVHERAFHLLGVDLDQGQVWREL